MRTRQGARAVIVGAVVALGLGTTGVASAMPTDGAGGKVSTGSKWRSSPASVEVMVNGLRARTGPGTGNSVLGMLYAGDGVSILGSQSDAYGQTWDRVALTGASAGGLAAGSVVWVSDAYVVRNY